MHALSLRQRVAARYHKPHSVRVQLLVHHVHICDRLRQKREVDPPLPQKRQHRTGIHIIYMQADPWIGKEEIP